MYILQPVTTILVRLGNIPILVCCSAWVTLDSVSMIFEALTAGLGVGLLEVPVRRVDRISALATSLVNRGQVTSFKGWLQGQPLVAPQRSLAEAARCADLILARWP